MISVRRIQMGEGELFKQIRLTSLSESPSAFLSTYQSALNRSTESWNTQADNSALGSDRATFFAFSGDTPIGIAALYRYQLRVNSGELLQVWVSPEYRGKGVALKLMDTLFRWARENGFQRVLATITKGNVRAMRFYQKYGFRFVHENSLNDPEESIVMEFDVHQI